ncbi:MAG: hypothetical protein K1X79_06075 [Oligoflexia bacterium]|nr:hypothetical protein [Oligoflexia bacterium]
MIEAAVPGSPPDANNLSRRAGLGLIVALIAALFCTFCGSRGFFPLDQSIVWDGAYRIAHGQVPFIDFYTPNGVALLYAQSLVFRIWGASFSTFLATAALMNAIGALLAMRLVLAIYPQAYTWAVGAGVLTAIWLFPPVGTPFAEPAAFLLCLAGVFCCVTPTLANMGFFLGGICLGLAFFTKQSIAIFIFPLFILLPLSDSRPVLRRVCWMFFGLLAVWATMLLWMFAHSAIPTFLKFTFELPYQTAIRRLPFLSSVGVGGLLGLGAVGFAALLALLGRVRTQLMRDLHFDSSDIQALFIALYLLLVSVILKRSMFNNQIISDALVGIMLALLASISTRRAKPSQVVRRTKQWGVLFVLIAAFGAFVGISRVVHEPLYGASFGHVIDDSALWPMRWAEPTLLQDGDRVGQKAPLSESDLLQLLAYLRQEPEPYFIFPDSTFIYALTASPSPQPLLWFHKGLTYPAEYDPNLDGQIVQALEKNGVRKIVLERTSLFGTQSRLQDFPLLKAWIEERFQPVKSLGIFDIQQIRN